MEYRNNKKLNVVIYGMTENNIKSMRLYFHGVCEDNIVIVKNISANAYAYLIDLDSNNGKQALETIQQQQNIHPIITLSTEKLNLDNVIKVEKPIRRKKFLNAINEAKKIINNNSQELSNNISARKNTTAVKMNNSNSYAYLGLIEDISNKKEISKAYYDPNNYFQGYVGLAVKDAETKMKNLELTSNWMPLFVFPRDHEIWLDADDAQLKAFTNLEMSKASGSKLTISEINYKKFDFNSTLKNFQDIDAFMWKLAIWTSKGRYPKSIEFKKPIYIKYWPNFTRLLLTPHALQITALLIQEPKKILDIAKILQIKLQYVFIFVSAALALNLIGQNLSLLPNTPKIAKKKNIAVEKKPPKGLLGRFMNKLRTFF